MPAMVMPFQVKDDWVFQAAKEGDEIRATLVVSDESSWLEEVVIVGQSSVDAAGPSPAIPGEPRPGDTVPDFTLINQDGHAIRLGQYRGKAVVLTFIYTRCPLPEYCPRMTSHFAKLEDALQEEPALHEKTHLLTVSFDFEHDSPAILRQYAGARIPGHSGSFRHWELATGSEDEIQDITGFFSLTFVDDRDQFVHSLRTAIIGPDGRLVTLYRGNDWEPEDILEDLKRLEEAE